MQFLKVEILSHEYCDDDYFEMLEIVHRAS